jgi:hypothetical protein
LGVGHDLDDFRRQPIAPGRRVTLVVDDVQQAADRAVPRPAVEVRELRGGEGELALDDEQRRAGGAGRAAACTQNLDRGLVLPVVQDGLEQVGVAACGVGLEEAAADDLDPPRRRRQRLRLVGRTARRARPDGERGSRPVARRGPPPTSTITPWRPKSCAAAAIRDTAASADPTCSNAHLQARWARLARGEPNQPEQGSRHGRRIVIHPPGPFAVAYACPRRRQRFCRGSCGQP